MGKPKEQSDKKFSSGRHEKGVRLDAAHLYWQGYRIAEVAERLDVPINTLRNWKRDDHWDNANPAKRVESALEARMLVLIAKEDKTSTDLNEIETLSKTMLRTARVHKFHEGGNNTDLSPKTKKRNSGERKPPAKNEIPPESIELINTAWRDELFPYQHDWWAARKAYRTRNILKSRQIGATWYFAREAFIDAMNTGDNQIFLSASKAQAHVFKEYIKQFARDVGGVELTGDPIVLPNGATLYFLGTNYKTAQSYHGHLYFDEYFWTGGFNTLNKVASGMAMHKRWKKTYFSTPSSLQHEAYAFWSGEHFNKGRTAAEHIQLDLSHAGLVNGSQGEDGQWRQIITVEDAMARGCNLFDLDTLRQEYSADEYNNLLMCQFADDAQAVFKLASLMRCMVDAWEVWEDYKPFLSRPLGERGVWVGYDPSRTRDDACLAVIAPPAVKGGKFRILEKMSFNGRSFEYQAKAIQQVCQRYRVDYMGIDASGMGLGVYELVKEFYPAATKIVYNVEVKTRLVLKAQSLVESGRLQFDAGDKSLAAAFMSIRKIITGSGQFSYSASRTESTGHADEAWAVMHAIDNLQFGFDGDTGKGSKNIVEIN